MSNNLILILCAGRASKWKGPVPKQCALVEGKPLIARTIEQIYDVWPDNTNVNVVAHDGLLWTNCLGWTHAYLVSRISPAYNRYICGTLLSTMHSWPEYDRVTVLLGDVVYSPGLLKHICRDTLPEGVRFYGSKHERWAITWKREFNSYMIEMLIHSAHLTAVSNALDKLATPFRLIAEHPLREPYGSDHAPFCPELYTLWDHDYVDDFDTVEEYEKWVKQNPWAQCAAHKSV